MLALRPAARAHVSRGGARGLQRVLALLIATPALFVSLPRALPARGAVPDAERIREQADRVFESPDFRHLVERSGRAAGQSGDMPGWFQRALDWLESLFTPSGGGGGGGGGSGGNARSTPSAPSASGGGSFDPTSIIFLLGALFISALVFWLVWVFLNRHKGERRRPRPDFGGEEIDLDLERPPGELESVRYLEAAARHAGVGEYRQAIRLLLIGSMGWIERRGLIRYRKGLTNRDYLRVLRGRIEERSALAGIALAFEEIYFGRRPATVDRFEDCRSRYESSFLHEPETEEALES